MGFGILLVPTTGGIHLVNFIVAQELLRIERSYVDYENQDMICARWWPPLVILLTCCAVFIGIFVLR